MTDFDKFLLWEAKSRDTIDFKKVYVDIAGDLVAGLLLSQIIYWYLPDEHGRTKLRVNKNGNLWIAKGRDDWWQEIRITGKQFDRASSILIEKGILIKDHFRFDGLRMIHIRLDYDHFMALWQAQLEPPAIDLSGNPQLPKGETRNYPKVKPAITLSANPLTESTAKTTTESLANSQNSQTNGSSLVRSDQEERDNLNALCDSIAKVTGVNIATAHKTTIDELKRLALSFYGLDVRPDDLKNFSSWWYDYSWQGKKGQSPTLKQVGDSWGQFEAQKVVNVPAISTDGGFYV